MKWHWPFSAVSRVELDESTSIKLGPKVADNTIRQSLDPWELITLKFEDKLADPLS